MEDLFIPRELALRLKGVGFKGKCIKGFHNGVGLYTVANVPFDFSNRQTPVEFVSCPTWEQVFNWLREEFGLYTLILPTITDSYEYRITKVISKEDYPYISGEKPLPEEPLWNGDIFSKYEYSQYEDARLTCLEDMIEVLEKQNN